MSFNKTPTNWIPNYTSNGTSITIPIASLSGLTAADADASTGDIRAIALALADKLYQVYNSTVTADRPKHMTLGRNTQSNDQTGISMRNYTSQFDVTVPSVQLAPES